MPSGFPVHVVALLHVIIYTYVGQTIPQTITAETFGKAQDEQTYVPKRLRSVCFDRCAKEAKVSPCNLHLNPRFCRLAQNTQAPDIFSRGRCRDFGPWCDNERETYTFLCERKTLIQSQKGSFA